MLFLDVKLKTGAQSDVERDFQTQVEAQGFPYEIARSLEDALGAFEKRIWSIDQIGSALAGLTKNGRESLSREKRLAKLP